MRNISVYIHYPYCIKKCSYCDFYSLGCGAGQSARSREDLLPHYLREIESWRSVLEGRTVGSIYFGGGTPSLMEPASVEAIIRAIGNAAGSITSGAEVAIEGAEITLEANPASVDAAGLRAFRDAGVNRLSVGVQSLDDAELAFLGRVHSSYEALEFLDMARREFDNISADFIYALPGQKPDEWARRLEEIRALGLPHYSLYQLIIERGTALARVGTLPASEGVGAKMLDDTVRAMRAAGVPQYEVSNFSRPGRESAHNLNYWNGGDYIGIGPSAAGRVLTNGRFVETLGPRSVTKWISEGSARKPMSKIARAREMVIMGLRMRSGINLAAFEDNSGMSIDKAAEFNRVPGLVVRTKTHVRLSVRGRMLLDYVLRRIL